jgi:hypothetical protein
VAANGMGEVGDRPGPIVPHTCICLYRIAFYHKLLPQFDLYMYFYLRSTALKKELRKFLIKAYMRESDNISDAFHKMLLLTAD